MKRYRVIVHGVFREPTAKDKDGSGFYTARMVQADSGQDAGELALQLVAKDLRASHSAGVAPERRAKLGIDQIVTLDCNDEFKEGPLGFVFYEGAQPSRRAKAASARRSR